MAAQCRESNRKVNVLVAQDVMPDSCHVASVVMARLHNRFNIVVRSLTHCNGSVWVLWDGKTHRHQLACDELVDWADLLIVTCLTAGSLSKMLQGGTDSFLLELLRSWDVSKKVLLVPAMVSRPRSGLPSSSNPRVV